MEGGPRIPLILAMFLTKFAFNGTGADNPPGFHLCFPIDLRILKRRRRIASPEGAQENSPGREPGVRAAKCENPEGATQ